MTELKNHPFLDALLRYARGIGGENMTLTAARFLLAVIAVVEDPSICGGADTTALRELLAAKKVDLKTLKEALSAHVTNNQSAGFMEGLYMQKLLMETREAAAAEGASLLLAEKVLTAVLTAPGAAVEKIFASFGAAPQAEAPTTQSGLLPDEIIASFRNLTTGDENSAQQSASAQTETAPASTPAAAKEPDGAAELAAQAKDIGEKLSNVVFGQNNAVGTFVSGFFQAELLRLTDKDRVRPATFLFAGPPGVGKTFLAEQAAKVLERPFLRLDMSEYSTDEATVEFAGSDDVYRNSKPGNVTSFVKKNPRSVLLFDEIEKAHLTVIHLFLQILDAGRLRDSKTDEEISFKDTILIFTTNAGKQLYEDSDTSDFSGLSKKVILRALQTDIDQRTGQPFFPAAICSRFASGNVVMFNHITANNLVGIAKRELARHTDNFEQKFNIHIDVDDAVYAALLFGEGGAADARTVRGRTESFFNAEIYELLRLMQEDTAKGIKTVKVDVKLPDNDPQIAQLFKPAEKPTALVFAKREAAPWCVDNETCNFVVTDTVEDAVQTMRDKDIAFVLVDILCGATENAEGYLNIEDVESDGRKFLQYVHAQYNTVPVYMARGEREYTPEEKVSFARQGVRGDVKLTAQADTFMNRITEICESIHQQNSMNMLAKANKVASYSTSQTVDAGTGVAYIHLFDFHLSTAVDAEDTANILSSISKPNVKFKEVIGAEEAKKELQYFIRYLQNPKKFAGSTPPKGVILYGPPGTGKTMLAKAMASESDVTFISASGSQFRQKYIGEGGNKVRELFKTARKYAPSILFIDEIDAIAQERTGGESSGSREAEATLTALLTEMDGFRKDTTKPVFVLAATNFDVEPGSARSLDAALMRRFDRRILVDLPNRDERVRYLKERAAANEAYQMTEEKFDSIGIRSTGMSLAFLESILELALRMAIRDGDGKVTDAVFDEAFEIFTHGERKDWDISTLQRVARHEAGHAFIYWYHGKTPSYLTVVARGNHGGYMRHDDPEKTQISTRADQMALIRTSLGGRAAELVYYGEEDGLSTGPSGDLVSATRTAQNVLCCYGMDETFGLAVVDPNGPMAEKVHAAVNAMLKEQLEKAVQIIRDNREKFDKLVEVLVAKNHMTGDEIEATLRD